MSLQITTMTNRLLAGSAGDHNNRDIFTSLRSDGLNSLTRGNVIHKGVIHACCRKGSPKWPRLYECGEPMFPPYRARRLSETSSINDSTVSGNVDVSKMVEEIENLKRVIGQLKREGNDRNSIRARRSFDDDGIGSMNEASPSSSGPPSPPLGVRTAGHPPPPPPLPPAEFLKVKPPKIVIARRSDATRKALNEMSKARKLDMMSVLKDLGSVKLRKVPRSPGGTPMRTPSNSFNSAQSDPGALIAQALRQKFQALHELSSDSEAELSFSSWVDED
uniref:Mitochondrial fission regulator 2 n=1 Tax=Steinernema glaseri TaxID=37863 RepID=A0A1I7YB00_9BILA